MTKSGQQPECPNCVHGVFAAAGSPCHNGFCFLSSLLMTFSIVPFFSSHSGWKCMISNRNVTFCFLNQQDSLALRLHKGLIKPDLKNSSSVGSCSSTSRSFHGRTLTRIYECSKLCLPTVVFIWVSEPQLRFSPQSYVCFLWCAAWGFKITHTEQFHFLLFP